MNRFGDRLAARRSSLLIVYLTLGDPLTTAGLDLPLAAVEAGADVIEVGIPTPSTAPKGAIVAESFQRAGGLPPERAFALLGEIRAALPGTPILSLIYPETVADLGRERLITESVRSGTDGLVLTAPDPGELRDVAAGGLAAIPVIRAVDDPAADALESAAAPATYRTMSPATGSELDAPSAGALAETLAATARKPFLAGFGISRPSEIGLIAPHAAGIVIGSELHRVLLRSAPGKRLDAARSAIREWKAATVVTS
ncbi:Tryptophan synthase alpha chain [Actinomadura sp. RB68]|uniref:tryptophan synthase n=2 Tax=Actinomadura macrotermitis TaxID=2585200 RepID=A0A7K0BV71_9ACTN|nr:Tryptophan synthase alpha chain [Actinomadura macrotermitis]